MVLTHWDFKVNLLPQPKPNLTNIRSWLGKGCGLLFHSSSHTWLAVESAGSSGSEIHFSSSLTMSISTGLNKSTSAQARSFWFWGSPPMQKSPYCWRAWFLGVLALHCSAATSPLDPTDQASNPFFSCNIFLNSHCPPPLNFMSSLCESLESLRYSKSFGRGRRGIFLPKHSFIIPSLYWHRF